MLKNVKINDKGWLSEKYLRELLNARQIASLCGVSKNTVLRRLKYFDIKTRPSYNCNNTKLSLETRNKISLASTKMWRKRGHRENISNKVSKSLMGHTVSQETKEKIRKNTPVRKGKNNNFWKGGISLLKDRIRNSFKFRQWRSDVFFRDNFVCQSCGKHGVLLNAHHIKSFSSIIKQYNIKNINDALLCEELWDINNGQTLCLECHKKTNNYMKG